MISLSFIDLHVGELSQNISTDDSRQLKQVGEYTVSEWWVTNYSNLMTLSWL